MVEGINSERKNEFLIDTNIHIRAIKISPNVMGRLKRFVNKGKELYEKAHIFLLNVSRLLKDETTIVQSGQFRSKAVKIPNIKGLTSNGRAPINIIDEILNSELSKVGATHLIPTTYEEAASVENPYYIHSDRTIVLKYDEKYYVYDLRTGLVPKEDKEKNDYYINLAKKAKEAEEKLLSGQTIKEQNSVVESKSVLPVVPEMNTEIEVFPTVINDDTVNTITIPDQNTIESTDNIEALKQEIEELKTKNGRLEQRVEQLETENGNLKAENDLLHTAYNGTIEQLNNTHDQINMAHATVEQKLNPNVMVDQSAYVKTNDSMMKSDPSMHK